MPLDNKTDTSTIQSDNPPIWHLWHYTTNSPLCGKKVLGRFRASPSSVPCHSWQGNPVPCHLWRGTLGKVNSIPLLAIHMKLRYTYLDDKM